MDIKDRIVAKEIFKQWTINSMQEHIGEMLSTHREFSAIYTYLPEQTCLEKMSFEQKKWDIRLIRYLRKEPVFWLEAHTHGGDNLLCLRRYNQMLVFQVWENEVWQKNRGQIEQQFNRWFNMRQMEQAYISHSDDIWWQEYRCSEVYHPDYRRTLMQERYLPYLDRAGLLRRMNEDEIYTAVCWKIWTRQKRAWHQMDGIKSKSLVQGYSVQLYDCPENFWLRDNIFLQEKIIALQELN